jgi:hypothetical protein
VGGRREGGRKVGKRLPCLPPTRSGNKTNIEAGNKVRSLTTGPNHGGASAGGSIPKHPVHQHPDLRPDRHGIRPAGVWSTREHGVCHRRRGPNRDSLSSASHLRDERRRARERRPDDLGPLHHGTCVRHRRPSRRRQQPLPPRGEPTVTHGRPGQPQHEEERVDDRGGPHARANCGGVWSGAVDQGGTAAAGADGQAVPRAVVQPPGT